MANIFELGFVFIVLTTFDGIKAADTFLGRSGSSRTFPQLENESEGSSNNTNSNQVAEEQAPEWPKILLASENRIIVNDLANEGQKTEEVQIFSEGVSTQAFGLTGANGTVCYDLAEPPFLECKKKNLTWTPVTYFRDRRDQVRRNSHRPRLELDDFGERLLYLDPGESKLHLIFLKKNNDRVPLLPNEQFETFAIDWNQGVLATVDQNSQLVLWAFNDSGGLDQMHNISVKAIQDFALTLDTDSSTLYILSSNKSLWWYMSYDEVSPLVPATLEQPELMSCKIQIRSHSSAFVLRSFLYFLTLDEATKQSVCRISLKSKNLKTDCHPLTGESTGTSRFEQLSLYISEENPRPNPCDDCSHRCFPKSPTGVSCGCPFSRYGVETDSKNICTSEKTVAAVIIKNETLKTSVVHLLNYVTYETKIVDLETATGTPGIKPIAFVPLWTSHDPERFCIQSHHSEELIITCHSYKNVNNFTKVPWKDPKTKLTLLAVTHLNDANSSWIVTWLENNDQEVSGCIRYQNSKTFETLTLYCHYGHGDGLWGYTDLKMDPAFLTIDPIRNKIAYLDTEDSELLDVTRTSDGERLDRFSLSMEPFRYSMSLKLNFTTVFGNRGLAYFSEFISKTLRFGQPSSSKVVTSRKLLAVVGPEDFCWLEIRKVFEHQTDSIVCTRTTRTQAEDTIVHKFSRDVKITSLDARILNPEEHHRRTTNGCMTGNHNCSHLCTPLAGNTTKNRYKCACPDEYPILLDERQCSLRLFIDVGTPNASNASSAAIPEYTLRVTEVTDAAPSIGNDTKPGLQYALPSGQLCRIERQGIVCDNQVLPGTQGATRFIKGHNQVRNEIYWLKPSSKKQTNQCLFLSSPGKNITMKLQCGPFTKIDGHVTVDAEKKILFWFTRHPARPELPMLNRLNFLSPKAKIASSKLPFDVVTYNMLESIACDFSIQKVFAAFYDPADKNSHIYETSYTLNSVKTTLLADYTHQITTIAAVQGNIFWFDKHSGWIYGKRPKSDRALKIRKIDETYLGESSENLEVLSIASAYTPSEMGLESLCGDTTCDYFCDVRATSTGPITQCLCPWNLTEPSNTSSFRDCPPKIDEVPTNALVLPLSLTFGLVIMIVAVGNIVWCVYSRQRQKRKIQHIVRSFMDGDVQRAESSKDNEIRAQFLPFTAIIPPDDLVLNEKKILGEGNFGTVYEGLYQRTPVAVKTTKSNLDPQTVQDFLRELKIQAYVGEHANVVSFFGAEVSRIQSSRILVVLELCPHGNLLDYMRKYSESENLSPVLGVGRTSYIETRETENGGEEEVIEMEEIEEESEATDAAEAKDQENKSTAGTLSGVENAFGLLDGGVPTPTTRQRILREEPTYSNVELQSPAEEQPPTVCFHWARQIAAGMEYLESKHVVHGDMAARNILVFENDTVKISDFGFSRNVYQQQIYQKKQTCALPYKWASPETLSRMEFSSKADVWSFGVTMWEIFTFGNMPFVNTYWDDYFVNKLVAGNLRLPKPDLLTQELHEQLLDVCWKVKPEERACFTELKETLDALHQARSPKV